MATRTNALPARGKAHPKAIREKFLTMSMSSSFVESVVANHPHRSDGTLKYADKHR
jgi:hypothetical protein